MYNKDSLADKGTLAQIQILLGRTNLPATKVKNDMNAVDDFMSLVCEAHIVASTMAYFKMSDINDIPSSIAEHTQRVPQSKDLEEIVGKLVDEYAMKFVDTDGVSPEEKLQTKSVGTQHPPLQEKSQDGVFNYATHIIGYGLLARNFQDAWREGDGVRTIRCWKFFLLYFKNDGRTKYALEAFKLIAQTSAMLTPRKAHQLIWNRSCNSKGGTGKNVPLDLKNEFLNAVFKTDLNTFHSNITQHSVERSSQSIECVQNVLDHFDHVTGLYKDSGRHVVADNSKDFELVLKTLTNAGVFTYHGGRQHKAMKTIHADPLYGVKQGIDALHKWLSQHRKTAAIEQSIDLKSF